MDTTRLVFPQKGGRYRFPFPTLEVGDYFIVTVPEAAASAWLCAKHHAKVHPGKRFTKVRVDGEGWRLIRVA